MLLEGHCNSIVFLFGIPLILRNWPVICWTSVECDGDDVICHMRYGYVVLLTI